jgi:hypothetical protein
MEAMPIPPPGKARVSRAVSDVGTAGLDSSTPSETREQATNEQLKRSEEGALIAPDQLSGLARTLVLTSAGRGDFLEVNLTEATFTKWFRYATQTRARLCRWRRSLR